MLTTLAERLRWIAGEERGSTIVTVAIALPVLLTIAALVINVANWFEDKRHLQTQADAAAFAGAQNFRASCDDTSIRDGAIAYAGDLNRNAGAFNQQISPTAAERLRVHALINSTDYWTAAGPNADYTDGTPCTKKYVDVKMTHSAPSFFFGSITPSGVLGAITAHARVQINQIDTLSGSMPLAVPDINPAAVAALFIDESQPMTQTPLATQSLSANGPATLNGRSLDKWSNIGSPVSVSIPAPAANQHSDVGVVIALSGNATIPLVGSVATICGQAEVDCYIPDATDTTWSGATYIHGYNAADTGTVLQPVAADVQLVPFAGTGGCTDSSPPGAYFVLAGNGQDCRITVRAKIKWNGVDNPAQSSVWVNGLGCNGNQSNDCPLAYNTTTGYWEGSTNATKNPTVSAASGPQWVNLKWQVGNGSGATSGDLPHVQRVYSVDDLSGPIQFVQLQEGGVAPANSLTAGAHSLVVVVGLQGALQNSTTPVILRLASSGAQTQTLNCDSSQNFKDEVQYGCQTPYQIDTAPPACHPALTPADCVPQAPGNKTAIVDALNTRFVTGGTCAPNNSNLIVTGNSQQLSPNDARIVPLIITSYGAFSHNPSADVPVVRFAAFYIAGWGNPNGSGASKTATACTGTPPPTGTGNTPYPNQALCAKKNVCGDTDIWGYFFKYIGQFGGSTGTNVCDLASLSPCVPVLTD